MEFISPFLEKIPTEPNVIKPILEKCPLTIAKAWLAFMYAAGYSASNNKKEMINQIYSDMTPFFNNKGYGLLLKRSFLSMENDKYMKNGENKSLIEKAFEMIRLAYDLEMSDSRYYAYPCFVDDIYPNESFAMCAFWWSSGDASVPKSMCSLPTLFKRMRTAKHFFKIIKTFDELETDDETKKWPGTISNTIWQISARNIRLLERSPLKEKFSDLFLANARKLLKKYSQSKKAGKNLINELHVTMNFFTSELSNILQKKYNISEFRASKRAQDIALFLTLYKSSYHCLEGVGPV
jgi:hypothetical protein